MAPRANPVATDGAFTVVAESAPGMVWGAQADGCRTFFNRTWLAFTGRPIEHESGNGWTRGIHTDDRARALGAYRNGVRTGARFELEYRLRRHDGEFRHVLDRAAPRIERGTLLGYIGACLDIEDRKAAEIALRASETRFRLLTENAVDVVYRYRVHPTYATEYISPAALAVCGRSPEEFIANPELGFSLVHPEDRAIARSMRHDPENLGKPTILRWLHADGRVVWTEHRGSAVYDAEGRFVAIEGIARDITDRVRAEQQRQLVEAQLRQSQEQLRGVAAAMEHARETERATIARELHDELGQSLTAIKLDLARMTRTLTQHGLTPAPIDNLQSMIGAVDVAIETVRRLATTLRPPALDDLGLVGAIELEGAAIARRTGMRCRVDGNRRLPPLDPNRTTGLFRIVQEALTNVVRHASAGSVRITIDGRGSRLTIKVRDNGRGMNADVAPGSSALGLLGMRERAEMIGARLEIASRRGKGTCVSVALSNARRSKKHS